MADIAEESIEERSPVQRAVRGVYRLIRGSRWTEGQRLPAEEALADLLKVSRSTVRKALDVLSQQGVVRRERNRGCIVLRNEEPEAALVSRAVVVVNDLLSPSETSREGASSHGIKQGMLDAAEQLGRTAFLMPVSSIQPSTTRQLMDARPQGLVMLCWRACSPDARRFSALIHEAGIPVVAFGMDEVPEAVARYDRVATDHESGTRKLLELLARRGCRRILRVWTPPGDCTWIAAHNRAYEKTVPALGLEVLPPVYIPGIPEQRDDVDAFNGRVRHFVGYLAEYLVAANPVDAIMVATDSESFNVASACRLLGRRPGVDVLITGYDNYWPMAFERKFEPTVPFATVDKNNALIGAELIRLLDERIAGPSARPPQFRCVEQEVMETHVFQASATPGGA